MDEAHQILLNGLEQAGVVMPIGVSTIQDVGSGSLVSVCSQTLHLINEDSSFPTSMPVSMADRFRLCTDLATAIKQLGYRGDLSFHQFLYPSEEDTYKLLRFMLERVSKSSSASTGQGHRRGRGRAAAAAGGRFTGEEKNTRVATIVRGALQRCVEEAQQGSSHNEVIPFRTCPLRLASARNLSKKIPPLITLQAKPKAWLCSSVLELNAKNSLKAGNLKDFGKCVEETDIIKVASHGFLEIDSRSTNRNGMPSTDGYLVRLAKYSEERDWVKSLEAYQTKKEESHRQELGKDVEDEADSFRSKDQENEKYIRELEEKLASLTTEASQDCLWMLMLLHQLCECVNHQVCYRLRCIMRSASCAIAGSSGSAQSSSLGNMENDLSCQLSSKDGSDVTLPSNLPPGHGEISEPMDSSSMGDDNQDNINDHVVRLDLTDDLLHAVFTFLDHKTLCKAGLVCRQWHASSVHEDFWRSLNFENCRITADQVARVCRRYPRAVELHLPGFLLDIPLHEALCTLRNLEVLTMYRGALGDSFFNSLVECPVLRRLSVIDATLGSGGSQEIHVRHDSLQHLQVMRCRALRIFVRCPQLETLSLKRSGMASAILTCPLLRELDVASCHKLSDPGIRAAAMSCPLLKSLDISNCSYVSDDTLREIAAVCTDLQILDASYCPNISLEAVRMPMLMNLKLHNCEGINATSMAALSQCYYLEALQLDFCWLLTSVTLDLPRLRHISLVNCRKIVDLNLSSPALASINVTSCPILNRVDITSNALQKLVLQKQQSLTTMTLQCLSLSEVDLSECESLTNSICEVFSVGGGCPMLGTLILDNCESLSNVSLTSTSLHTLSLTGCRGVTGLRLACPKLQKVCLDGCDHLQIASFSPVGLQSLNLGICPYLSKLEIRGAQMTLLELKGCGVLSQADINCPQLQSLDASFCSLLNDDCLDAATAACPSIESLVLMSCTSIGPDGLLALRRLSNLTSLDLSYTFLTNLQPIIDSCPQLKVLKLQACKYLEDTALVPLHRGRALPKVSELDLSYGTLSQSAIEELLACCLHLTHVSLNGCANMHDLDWRFEASKSYSDPGLHRKQSICDWTDDSISEEGNSTRLLQTLNFVGCLNIKKVVIPTSAQCGNLCFLNLSLSANIQDVSLACVNLITLNLSNCLALEILQLDCPRLASLLLQACGIKEHELEHAIFSCHLLETLDVRSCPKISLIGISKFRSTCPTLKRLFSNA